MSDREHERIIRPETCTEEQLMEQIWARVVLDDLEHGGTGREPTWDEMELLYEAAVVVAQRIRRMA